MRLTTSPAPGWHTPRRSLQSRIATAAGLLVMLCSVFALDVVTDSTPVQHLYYVPIILAALRFGVRGGMVSALTAIAMYHVANPRLLIWNYQHWDVVQVALFLAVGSVTAKLVADSHRLNVLAMTDDLTGLHNLRSFETHLVALVRDCRKAAAPLAVLVLDVDRLKSLNDVHGHLVGAEAVRAIGHTIGACVPATGVACRYGGDEFVMAVPDCTDMDCRALGEQLRRDVQSMAPDLAGVSFPQGTLSVSVGIASQVFAVHDSSQSDAALGERLFREADRALYHAKERGRNRVHVA